jgi:glycosyltransferase involved in cell wall biosynthesis
MLHDVAVVLPAYNEAIAIGAVVRDMRRVLGDDAYIVVVDNRSTDGTAAAAREALASGKGVVLTETVQGKSQAVRRAFLSVDARVYVLCDADDTYPVEALPEIVRRVANGDVDMAIGDRHGNGSYAGAESRRFHGLGNRLIAGLLNRIFGGQVGDALSGLRVFSRRFVKNYPILSRGFALETDMTAFALDRRFRVVEFAIDYRARPKGSESKLRTIPDGFRVVVALFNLARFYRPLFFFGWIGVVLGTLGFMAGVPVLSEYFLTGLVPRLPLALLATGLGLTAMISFAIGLILDGIAFHQRAITERALLSSE